MKIIFKRLKDTFLFFVCYKSSLEKMSMDWISKKSGKYVKNFSFLSQENYRQIGSKLQYWLVFALTGKQLKKVWGFFRKTKRLKQKLKKRRKKESWRKIEQKTFFWNLAYKTLNGIIMLLHQVHQPSNWTDKQSDTSRELFHSMPTHTFDDV